MITFESLGAAQTVTGSKHLIRTSQACVLLDCGLFQGHRKEANEKNRNFSIEGRQIDAVILSHAHLDHSGALPCLYKNGYRGSIYATPATRDLCAPMLMDTAWIMKSDAEHIQRLIKRGARHLEPVEALYDDSDVSATLAQFIGIPYHHSQVIAPGITLTFYEAGHVLGSAVVVLDITDGKEKRRLAFTGDLGRKHLPILRTPEVPAKVNCLISESTYGDRVHEPFESTVEELRDIITRTHQRGGKVVIPSFALERAQEVIYEIKKLRDGKKIPFLPVYVDSPLTVKITDVFKLHPECYDAETLGLLQGENSPFEFPGLTYISSIAESKRVSQSKEPMIIIAASGMCEGGRVLHHLEATLSDLRNTIVIVGYQAEATLGRKIAERQQEVRIFGALHPLAAEVKQLNGFSGHADQNGLLKFANAVRANGSLNQIILVHGESKAQTALQAKMKEEQFESVLVPAPLEVIQI